jgi:hypothetical protein
MLQARKEFLLEKPMKNLFFAMAFSLSSYSAVACSNPEAQFTGVVTSVEKYETYHYITECFYKVKFTDFKASSVCPLDEEVAVAAEFSNPTCDLKEGAQVSGYLVVKNGEVIINN